MLFRVTDLKEYTYCPRVFYYENCLPDLQPSTYKMEAGVRAHEKQRKKSVRHSLNKFDIQEGERQFNVSISSQELGIVGELDEAIITPDEVVVVDYKLAKTVGRNFKLQLGAYALLANEFWQKPVTRAYIYLIWTRKLERIDINKRLKNDVHRALEKMQYIVENELMPPRPKHRKICVNCKHRRFCNDV